MFSDDLGFNPFDKTCSVNAGGHSSRGGSRQRFLESFGINHTFCYNGDPRKKISSMNHSGFLNDALTANLEKNSDVYFYINGGRKMYAIN